MTPSSACCYCDNMQTCFSSLNGTPLCHILGHVGRKNMGEKKKHPPTKFWAWVPVHSGEEWTQERHMITKATHLVRVSGRV